MPCLVSVRRKHSKLLRKQLPYNLSGSLKKEQKSCLHISEGHAGADAGTPSWIRRWRRNKFHFTHWRNWRCLSHKHKDIKWHLDYWPSALSQISSGGLSLESHWHSTEECSHWEFLAPGETLVAFPNLPQVYGEACREMPGNMQVGNKVRRCSGSPGAVKLKEAQKGRICLNFTLENKKKRKKEKKHLCQFYILSVHGEMTGTQGPSIILTEVSLGSYFKVDACIINLTVLSDSFASLVVLCFCFFLFSCCFALRSRHKNENFLIRLQVRKNIQCYLSL